jgi:hypothetical protein
VRFYDFHIQYPTERYQLTGFSEDAYAEATNRYKDFNGALICMVEECGLQLPPGAQMQFL